MDIINCIDILYEKNIFKISKFELYKILKQVHKNYTYYKLKKTFNKLKDTNVIIETYGKNMFIFNKIVEIKKPSLTLYFD